MTEMQARREAVEARARGELAIATHARRERQWVVIYGPITFE